MFSLRAINVPRAYSGMINYLRIAGEEETTRLGKVMAIPEAFGLTISMPYERVLFDKERDANPFFHLMEAIWMFAGEDEVKWLLQFNKGFSKYAEHDGHMRGAYGFRWRYHFGLDQLLEMVRHLQKDPNSRRAVLSMWDPGFDLDFGHNDYPCNTHIYFRNLRGALEMTVCNRSNDAIWGMLGSNAVHMTMLQEIIATASGLPIGSYHVLTNNLHIYRSLPNFEALMANSGPRDLYGGEYNVVPHQIMEVGEDIRRFLTDCTSFVQGYRGEIKNKFLRDVAWPLFDCWQARKAKLTVEEQFSELNRMPPNNDWRKAAEEWILRRETSSSSTLTEPSQTMTQGQNGFSEVPKENNGTSISPLPETTSPSTTSSNLSNSSVSTAVNQSGSFQDDQIPF